MNKVDDPIMQRYYIIESDSYQFRRIHAEPLNRFTFFTIYARVFSWEEIQGENIEVICIDDLDEDELGPGKFAINTNDTFSLAAIEKHYKKWYPNLMRHEEDRNNYVASLKK